MMMNDIECIFKQVRSVKHLNYAVSWNAWDILTALFPVLRVFWRSNMAFAVEKYVFKPLEMAFPRL